MANVVKEKETEKEAKEKEKSGVDMKQAGDRAAYVAKLYDQSLTLELLTWLGTLTSLPIVVKGVLRGDSAAAAARHPNVRGIVVSNHGGRQLDNCIAPLTALPEIVRVVEEVNVERARDGLPPVEVFVDGGIKRGRDIFKALALGAKAVLVGRPMIYGMAVRCSYFLMLFATHAHAPRSCPPLVCCRSAASWGYNGQSSYCATS